MKKSSILLLCSLLAVETSAQVFPSWISNNHFPGASSSTATVVNVDQSGYVFMGGTQGTNFVIKHNPDGEVLWLQTYDCGDTISEAPNTLCVDNQGNAYITFMKHTPGGTYWSIAVQRYNDSDGAISWTSELANAQFNGFEWQVKPTFMTIDDNYLYVAGTKFEPGVTGSEMLVMKLDFEGQILWNETLSGTGIYANAKSICVDQSGYIYIAGDAWNASIDYCVAKFDPNGNLVWDEFLDGDVYHNTDIAENVIVDDAGNVYITGYNQISSNLTDIVTVKYDQNGVFQWKHSYGNPGYRDNNAYYLAITEAGDLLVGGYSAYEDPYPGTGKDYILLKYSPSGSLIWDARYDHHNFLNDHPFDFDLGPSGDVYICGITMKSCYPYNFVTIVKINPQGDVVWDVWVPKLYGIPWEIEVIGDDDFVVAAAAFDSIQVNDATTVRYQAATPPVYEADVLDVYFESQVLPPLIDYENHRVIATVHDTANLAYLVPFITRSEHSCMYPEDEIITSFIEPVWYNITSFDEQTEKWWYLIVDGGYVGISEKNLTEHIKIYPNPTSYRFKVQTEQCKVSVKGVEIIDMYGKVLESLTQHLVLHSTEFDISLLQAGIYFARIYFDNQMIVKKVVKL
ncbi:MAG: T9SS type A sorting domain-containing protein [Bacteroidales bacterium]|nr:T9SS type A sorting domain-containing protein [Bacteroidales bacterium]